MQHITIDGVTYELTVLPSWAGGTFLLGTERIALGRRDGPWPRWWKVYSDGTYFYDPQPNLIPVAFKNVCVAWLQSGQYGGMTLKEFLGATNATTSMEE